METLRVLVVDDEPGMRAGVARSLGRFTLDMPEVGAEVGFEVAQAETGEQALEAIEADQPDILLLDHKLPGISGLDVLERIADRTETMLTIVITAYASLETAVTAIKQGAYDFLAKPFTPTELKSTVRKASRSIINARQARRLAEEKRQVRFQFINVLAHELKAPLSAVEGYLHICRDRSAGDDPATYEHMMDRCLLRAQHMRKMVMDLLDLTRIESGRKRRELADVDLCEVARTSIETMTPDAAERDVTLDLHADCPLELRGDRGELEIVLNNLVSNAVKYNRDGGRVDVTLEDRGDTVAIRVADTGIGMEQADADRLFQEFVRIKNAKTRDILGSGLGLSIVKKLATLYGGEVRVESTPDVGSTFTVTLSKQTEAAEAVLEARNEA